MLRRRHVSKEVKFETASDAFQSILERRLPCVRRERGRTMVATERNDMAGFLTSFQTPRHKGRLRPATTPLKPKPGLNGPPPGSRGLRPSVDDAKGVLSNQFDGQAK